MKQVLKSIHPLCWFLLGWLAANWVSYWIYPYRADLRPLAFGTILVVIQCAIYWLGFSMQMKRSSQCLILFIQAVLVLVVTQISQAADVAFALSLVLLVAIIEMFKQVRSILLATGIYLALFLLYASTLGSQIPWHYLWRGDNYVTDIPVLLILIGIAIYTQQKRAHARTQGLLRELNRAHAQLSAYALRVEELTMLTERQRLARELHDTLTQGVAGLIMQLEAANSYFGKDQPEHAHEIVSAATNRARTVLTETRYVLQDLRADSPRADDLPEMVQEEIDIFMNNTGTSCFVQLDALAATPDAHSGHILRAISEGLTNIARHAQAQQVWICASERAAQLDIEIRDDGIGFDPANVATFPGHYGLDGLRERVRLIGGQITILSSPGQGTSIRISLPTGETRSCA